ncbi:AFR286Wp [Eremothecium gossypii ATCC 10895]|uniref:AFR286Wp n=1 Tax=Eremothecium gossypii (strain ATCC 10895 / CBS 109.51 / FGSC 9923 / NRRL Y-1056) TaxID=284811 RepID=Q753M6_EREGS|nr:AFR286Wp [Eremothecium gossypii ATCC 10895]AAS53657.1 AFR286Wp [Eremothecium gossypii ATCC 10895]
MSDHIESKAESKAEEVDYSRLAARLGLEQGQVQQLGEQLVRTLWGREQAFRQLEAENTRLKVSIGAAESACEHGVEALRERQQQLAAEAGAQQRGQGEAGSAGRAGGPSVPERVQQQLEETERRVAAGDSARRDLARLLEEKISDLDASQQELERVLGVNKELRRHEMELEFTVQSQRSQSLREQAEIQRLQQELALVRSNAEWTTGQLNEKNQQLNSYREKTNGEIQSTQVELNIVKNELEVEHANVAALRSKNGELSKQLQDALCETKRLTDSLHSEKQEFAREMALKQRLIELLNGQVATMKQDLEKAYDVAKNGGMSDSERERLLNDLFDTKKKLELSQANVSRLEDTIKELLETDNVQSGGRNGIEHANVGSPSGGSTISTVYGDLAALRKQLVQERRHKEELQLQVESFVVELEHKIPVLNSFKKRIEELEKQLNGVTLLLEATARERDEKVVQIKQYKNKVGDYETQVGHLVQQRSDLARQVQCLLIHISVRDDSSGPLTAEEVEFVKKLQSCRDSATGSDTQAIISNRLVEFKSVVELQQKNAELLNAIRQLAQKLEQEEHKTQSKVKSLEQNTVNEAKEAILSLQEHVQMLEDQLETVTTERDSFKLLVSEGKNNSLPNPVGAAALQPQEVADGIAHLEARLKAMAEESEQHAKMLNEEIKALYKSNSQLAIELERERSSRELADEKLSLIQKSLELVKGENADLQNRAGSLQALLLEQDTRRQSTIEEFVSAKSELFSISSQLTILQSERDFLRKVEADLKKENESLNKDNNDSQLLILQLKTAQKERDSLIEETRKRYETRIEELDGELSATKQQLERKQREYDELSSSSSTQCKWFQSKLDSLKEELGSSKLALKAKTSELDALKARLNSSTSKLEPASMDHQQSSLVLESDHASRVQSLSKDLDEANRKLSSAYSEIERYKAASNATERPSLSYNAVQDNKDGSKQAAISLEAELTKLNSDIAMANDRIKVLEDELNRREATYSTERSELQEKINALVTDKQRIEEAKADYQQKITQLQTDLEKQISSTNEAETKYQTALQKQAEISENIESLRKSSESYKSEIAKFKSAAEEARKVLERNEQTWDQQKADIEANLDLAHQRIEELSTQNRLLYDQIELLSRSPSSSLEPDTKISSDARELIVTLRRERDILETKIDVSKREEKMLRQRLELTKSELDNLRAQLSESKGLVTEGTDSSQNQEELFEKLNQLNLLREHNMSLRNESEKVSEHNEFLQNEILSLQEKVQPMEEQIKSLTATLTEKEQKLALLKEESDRWKQRSQDILHKYERIDPEEYRKLASEIEVLKAELERKSAESIDSQERFRKLRKQANERLDEFKAAKAKVESELELALSGKSQLEAKLSEAREKITSLETQLTERPASEDDNPVSHELEETKTKLQDAENTINMLKSEWSISEESFKKQLDELNKQLETIQKNSAPSSGHSDPSSYHEQPTAVLEDFKKQVEEERRTLIESHQQELTARLEASRKNFLAEKEKALEELRDSLTNVSVEAASQNLEALKKKWEEEYEQQTLQRIREAEEALKKRIRLPSEERINQVIERKQKALEQEFTTKVNATALALLKENPDSIASDKADLIKDHQKEIVQLKKDLADKFEGQLVQVKKKAFEEGRQQGIMKVKLLESKISKLESQAKAPLGTNVPTKIPLENTQPLAQQVPVKPSPFQLAYAQATFGNVPFLFNKNSEQKKVEHQDDSDSHQNTGNGNKRQSEDRAEESPGKKLREE